MTNTTKESRSTLLNRLHRIGFKWITENDMFTSLSAAVQYVRTNNLSPLYLLTDDAKGEFDQDSDSNAQNAVVVGLAPEHFNYDKMNEAFRFVTSLLVHRRMVFCVTPTTTTLLNSRVLMRSKSNLLVAVHEGKYYKRSDGLAVGPGCFTKGLEYATGKKAIVIGKPNRYFFECVMPENVAPAECCMIGDVSRVSLRLPRFTILYNAFPMIGFE